MRTSWSFHISGAIRPIVGQALSPATGVSTFRERSGQLWGRRFRLPLAYLHFGSDSDQLWGRRFRLPLAYLHFGSDPANCGAGAFACHWRIYISGAIRANRGAGAFACHWRIYISGAIRTNRGAGAFACQPRARPMPATGIGNQAGAYRVVLHIVNQTVQFRFIPHTMVEGFILPEGLPGPAKNQVGLSRGGAFQPTHDHRQ